MCYMLAKNIKLTVLISHFSNLIDHSKQFYTKSNFHSVTHTLTLTKHFFMYTVIQAMQCFLNISIKDTHKPMNAAGQCGVQCLAQGHLNSQGSNHWPSKWQMPTLPSKLQLSQNSTAFYHSWLQIKPFTKSEASKFYHKVCESQMISFRKSRIIVKIDTILPMLESCKGVDV